MIFRLIKSLLEIPKTEDSKIESVFGESLCRDFDMKIKTGKEQFMDKLKDRCITQYRDLEQHYYDKDFLDKFTKGNTDKLEEGVKISIKNNFKIPKEDDYNIELAGNLLDKEDIEKVFTSWMAQIFVDNMKKDERKKLRKVFQGDWEADEKYKIQIEIAFISWLKQKNFNTLTPEIKKKFDQNWEKEVVDTDDYFKQIKEKLAAQLKQREDVLSDIYFNHIKSLISAKLNKEQLESIKLAINSGKLPLSKDKNEISPITLLENGLLKNLNMDPLEGIDYKRYNKICRSVQKEILLSRFLSVYANEDDMMELFWHSIKLDTKDGGHGFDGCLKRSFIKFIDNSTSDKLKPLFINTVKKYAIRDLINKIAGNLNSRLMKFVYEKAEEHSEHIVIPYLKAEIQNRLLDELRLKIMNPYFRCQWKNMPLSFIQKDFDGKLDLITEEKCKDIFKNLFSESSLDKHFIQKLDWFEEAKKGLTQSDISNEINNQYSNYYLVSSEFSEKIESKLGANFPVISKVDIEMQFADQSLKILNSYLPKGMLLHNAIDYIKRGFAANLKKDIQNPLIIEVTNKIRNKFLAIVQANINGAGRFFELLPDDEIEENAYLNKTNLIRIGLPALIILLNVGFMVYKYNFGNGEWESI